MWYISRRSSVTLVVLYRAQPVECLAGQEYLLIQVQKWYHYQPPPLYAKNEQDIDSLIHLTRMFSSDIGMTFGLVKCGCPIVNRGKIKSTREITRPEGQIDDMDESYKYLGIVQSFRNNDEEVRHKAPSEYRNRVRRVLRSKIYSKNKVTAINTFAVPVIQCPAAVVSWRREDLEETDIGTRKLITMHGVFHAKSSSARLYTSRNESGSTASKMLCAKKNKAWSPMSAGKQKLTRWWLSASVS